MQVSPSGMAAASQAAPGEFDSRHLLQKREALHNGVLLSFGAANAVKAIRLSRARCGLPCARSRSRLPIGVRLSRP